MRRPAGCDNNHGARRAGSRILRNRSRLSRKFNLRWRPSRAALPDFRHRPLLLGQRDSKRRPESLYVSSKAPKALSFKLGAGLEPIVLHGLGGLHNPTETWHMVRRSAFCSPDRSPLSLPFHPRLAPLGGSINSILLMIRETSTELCRRCVRFNAMISQVACKLLPPSPQMGLVYYLVGDLHCRER
jgi:hypothetical protein